MSEWEESYKIANEKISILSQQSENRENYLKQILGQLQEEKKNREEVARKLNEVASQLQWKESELRNTKDSYDQLQNRLTQQLHDSSKTHD